MTFLQLKNIVNALPDDMDENVFYNLYRQLHHTGYVDTDDAVNLAEERMKKMKEFARRMMPCEPYDYKRDEIEVYAKRNKTFAQIVELSSTGTTSLTRGSDQGGTTNDT